MGFVQDLEYKLRADLHFRVMLAFRYGIENNSDYVTAYFKKYDKEDQGGDRRRCTFIIEGVKVKVVITDQSLITALGSNQLLQDRKANALAIMFDAYFSLPIEPSIFSLSDVVEWREKYLNGGGHITKDDLRREAKSKGLDLPWGDPYEMLGISESFFAEVRELRANLHRAITEKEFAETEKELAEIDFTKDIGLNDIKSEWSNYEHLARIAQTRLWEEIPENIEELKRELDEEWAKECYEFNREMVKEAFRYEEALRKEKPNKQSKDLIDTKTIAEIIYLAEYGLPLEAPSLQVGITKSHQPVYYYENCTVLKVVRNTEPHGWSQIFYEYEGRGYSLATKFIDIINSYEIGSKGIWVAGKDKSVYLNKPIK